MSKSVKYADFIHAILKTTYYYFKYAVYILVILLIVTNYKNLNIL